MPGDDVIETLTESIQEDVEDAVKDAIEELKEEAEHEAREAAHETVLTAHEMRVRELEDRLVNQHQEHERWKTETTSSLESLKSEIAALRESLQASRTALTMAEAKLEAEMEPHQAHDSESSEDVGEALEIEAEPPTPPEAPLANEEGRERRHLHRLFGKR